MIANKHNQVILGMIWAGAAAVLWSISGIIMQYISQKYSINAFWYLSCRTVVTGLILITVSWFLFKDKIFAVFKSKKVFMWLIIYAVFGLAANMLTFYFSVQLGNVAIATILQYLAPLFILVGGLVIKHKIPLPIDILVFALAILGIILSVTRGDLTQLAVPLPAIIWGILAGITAAGYVVLPIPVIRAGNSPIVVLAWSMLIDAVIFNIIHPLWVNGPVLNSQIILGISGIILFGTIGAFLCELFALRLAPSADVSLMDAVQPLSTFVLSIIAFHLNVNIFEIIGAILIIYSVYLLQRAKRKLSII